MSRANDWVLAHRGVWEDPAQKNSLQSFSRAFESSLGVETDFRDYQGNLVLSHDIFFDQQFIAFEGFNSVDRYAINIKSDGLIGLFLPFADEIRASGSFVFDGSVPEMIRYRNAGIPHALRLSEYETEIPWKSEYLWIDAFNSDWWIADKKIAHLFQSHHLVFVSPELHGRDHRLAFEAFVDFRGRYGNVFSVCTDLPLQLLELFDE
jgi:hypothetical protein